MLTFLILLLILPKSDLNNKPESVDSIVCLGGQVNLVTLVQHCRAWMSTAGIDRNKNVNFRKLSIGKIKYNSTYTQRWLIFGG